ncbi:MAG TPA: S8 family serine peptidase [Phycisphaerales bacterium]|nr:S8 family serine peptidase [Phycisphaerales bacterium]
MNRQASFRRSAVVVIALIASSGLCTSFSGAQQMALPANEHQLLLSTGVVNTNIGGLALADATAKARVKPVQRFVIQLDGPMTPERRAAIQDAGIVLGDYLPVNAYVADFSRADAAKLGGLVFIRWTGEFSNAWKRDPQFNQRNFSTVERQQLAQQGKAAIHVSFFPGVDTKAVLAEMGALPGVEIRSTGTEVDRVLAAMIVDTADADLIASFDEVQWVEEAPELTERNTSDRWIVQSNVLNFTPLYDHGIHGEGQILGHMDSAVDQNHCSFSDPGVPIGPTHRKIVAYHTSAGSVSHGTHTAGTAVGDAGADTETRGVAYMGKLAYNSIPSFVETTVYDRYVLAKNDGARMHSNSWGNDGTTSYDGMCRAIDRFTYDFEDNLVLFAVTNTSSLKNPENAKNLLAVGASGDTPSQNNFCSGGTGPTSDGRRKPEIYAPGCNIVSAMNSSACGTRSLTGTSMACPAVTGTAMLVRQYYMDGFYPSGSATPSDSFTPSGALVKATLLNSAVDMTGISGFPSNQEGWGRVLADNAVYFSGDARKLSVTDVRNASGLTTGQVVEQPFNVAGAGQFLKATLVWTEPAAAAGASQAAINNLDFEIVGPGGVVYKGNVFSGGQSTTGGTADAINNVEMVLINTPAVGAYVARIKATAVNVGTQGYALVITGDIQSGFLGLTVGLDPGTPTTIAPESTPTITANIDPRADTLVGGSPTLFYRYTGGAFQSVPMSNTSGTTWQASLPAVDCSDTPEFYVSAAGTETGVVTDPPNGATSPRAMFVGEFEAFWTDNFETDQGWFVTNDASLTGGAWGRAVPISNGSQPGTQTTPGGQFCYVTQNGTAGQTAGATDVDGGPTRLTSPTFDLSDTNAATLSFSRWVACTTGEDALVVEVSNNSGSSWTTLQSITNNASWVTSSYDLGATIPLTATMRLRFSISDNPNTSTTDAAIDDVVVNKFVCTTVTPPCPGDVDGDLQVGLADIAVIVQHWTLTLSGRSNGDLDGDGFIGLGDIALVIEFWGQSCARSGRSSMISVSPAALTP